MPYCYCYFVIFISFCLPVCLVAGLFGKGRTRSIILGVAATAAFIAVLITTGPAAGYLLEGQDSIARVSLGTGFWLAAGGAYIVIFSARQGLIGQPIWRYLVSFTGMVTLVVLLTTGWFDQLPILQEFYGREERFLQELRRHVFIFAGSVGVGTILGMLLGIWAARSRRAESPIFFIANITQTIPSLALFGLLIARLSALSFSFPVLRDFGIVGLA